MKIIGSKPKGQRIFKSQKVLDSLGRKVLRPLWIEPVEEGFVFDLDNLEWTKEFGVENYTTAYFIMDHFSLKNIYSLKAAKRHIRKWKAPEKTVFKVLLPFKGFEFYVTKYN